ncbi:helix-turn-helix domain-containing protein [Microbacteriaceae bacterium VKM Ac-2854]|nr:helix-turn-helix domain-containing protein [Microbacteriaceae bacterium VKM Ac-2854]
MSDSPTGTDAALLGQRIRHFRTQRGLTLGQLATRVGVSGSQLSLVETGRREPRLSLMQAIANGLGIELAQLLSDEPPTERAALEIELARVQKGSLYRSLGLAEFKVNKGLPTPVLEAFLGVYRELARRKNEASATPEEARRANTQQRHELREKNSYLPEIEAMAGDMLRIVGHRGGALTHSSVSRMARHLGFEIIHVGDLPHSARSVIDLANGRIYLPPASIPGGHGLRALALQAMAHRLLGHERPETYADFLRQRLEINYFAAACLMPLDPAVDFLLEAKKNRDISVEDFRDGFGVTHEAAALRFTNLLTSHLDIRMHFLRVLGDGSIQKAYENDGIPLPTDVTGAVEGQLVCKYWSARSAFSRTNRTTEYYQYVDTPAGTFWSASQTGTTATEEFSITVGVPFADAKWFRGRDTDRREQSRCPDESCCRRAPSELAARWDGNAWPSARLHAHILAPLPSGTFPGIDDAEVYAFLDAHAQEA